MINDDKRAQTAGDGSTNTQANEVTINNGISYRDAKEIALDVFKLNFLELRTTAEEIAKSRAEEITEKFLKKMQETKPDALSSMNTPGMQMAIFEAQKSYAKTGSKQLENILVDILTERSESDERSLKQITLDEAIIIAPKLTEAHISILTLNCFVTKFSHYGIKDYKSFTDTFIGTLKKLSESFSVSNSSISYLKYTGCITPLSNQKFKNIEELIQQKYTALFMHGYTNEELNDTFRDVKLNPEWICLNQLDQTKTQIAFITEKFAIESLEHQGENKETINFITKEYKKNKFTTKEIRNLIESQHPELKDIFEYWEKSLTSFDLTAVGVAIAVSNFNRLSGADITLDEWIGY
tara:strand:+ start:333 stop:1391 length:1059 start_codon:yes stop_codon:yes gene_type:complete